MKFFNNMSIENHMLHLNGHSVKDLAESYGTPLYVLDTDYIKTKCNELKQHFKHPSLETEILYASKAFSSKAMYELVNELGLSLDVVSGGELYTAKASNFPMDRVYMHGNNKSFAEIQMALDSGVHRIIVDNLMELEYLQSLNRPVDILIRINPGIEAHTHEYIQTANDDSKFGISFDSYDLSSAIDICQSSDTVTLHGFHCHIGSQIHEASSFEKTASVMLDQIKLLEHKYSLNITELNLGGGFGVYYSKDQPITDYGFLTDLLNQCSAYISKQNLKIKKMMIEPGRLLVANAGSTIYQVGFTKTTASGKNYVFVDGGMTDNIRPALYQAEYEACIGNKADLDNDKLYTIAGKCCESGDILIKDILLPQADQEDYLVIASTGAYGYSMASHYNRLPKPAVIMIENGQPKVAIKRETYQDLIQYDL
ncbi:diaminopimelate decarboxylase [Acidaminobacter sp. JC074]|uniref:diaminopimelate decarboxylase n=1 Tax=Acidaminobacter sp. JC074 TaxID=2530199 RepID=UPI001F114FF3|nr:diaminopimelate decarboxylase [Acidaminobacter sp. JC074]MCH4890414.1 diaminopimelate decarboxylase [Acidaminobacter sp. JC074]